MASAFQADIVDAREHDQDLALAVSGLRRSLIRDNPSTAKPSINTAFFIFHSLCPSSYLIRVRCNMTARLRQKESCNYSNEINISFLKKMVGIPSQTRNPAIQRTYSSLLLPSLLTIAWP